MTAGKGKARALIRALPLVLLDVVATAIAFVVATWGTGVFDYALNIHGFSLYVGCLSLVNVAVFAACQMYSMLWEYASVDEAGRIVAVTLLGAVVGDVLVAVAFGQRLPIRVYAVAWVIVLVVSGASRFAIRLYSSSRGWSLFGVREKSSLPRTLIVGAGETGSLTVKRMLSHNPDVVGCPVGLVDDKPSKLGSHIHGVKVIGTCDQIPSLCSGGSVDQIIVAVPSATKEERERIYRLCMRTGVHTLTISDELKDAGERIPLREVDVADLLAREEKQLDLGQMGYVAGKRVLVTGGGGSIGSELVRQLLPAKPAQIILFDIYENTTYELFHDIVKPAKDQGTDIRVFIGSITHMPALEKVFDLYEPEVVFHAAAHKHVPLMERNAREAIENNVFGTLNLVKLADQHKCTHFVQISTDKAVNPTNIMGASKRLCEMVIQMMNDRSKTEFVAVRFGNVLGSNGSVIPLFKKQIEEGGPVTVTHPDIIRYFMTIPEAVSLVLQAGAQAKGGEIFVLDMGKPVKILDLALNLIRLSGLKPYEDIDIQFTGLRPGEKLYEELLMSEEGLQSTENKLIHIGKPIEFDEELFVHQLEELNELSKMDSPDIKKRVAEIVPTYHMEEKRQ